MSKWVSVHARNVGPGDVIRVRLDAYRGSLGDIHNGRICQVLDVRDGDVVVKSIDGKLPILTATHHSPTSLEKEELNETLN